ncbi:MAG: dTDP-4-dehydrorhamnose reductase [Desulfobacteraceae bacterium]|nr:MAG: dTDP-4-dehydrorhamnose reductase [Desulfobacteraceae bacterium]
MKALIAGGNGQLGRELLRTAPVGWRIEVPGRDRLDLRRPEIHPSLMVELRPDLVINVAAYTAVDTAEAEPEQAHAINAAGAAMLADAAHRCGARFISLSTDFVFDGSRSTPYRPGDVPHPLNVYGATKLAGEELVAAATAGQALIVRTAWLYSIHGNNFVRTILRLAAERESLSVVGDQIGTPTWAKGLAQALWRLADSSLTGVVHWTDAGVASWYDFAVAVIDEGVRLGLLDKPIPVRPVASVDWPTAAKRPPYSVLDKSKTWQALGYFPLHWQQALREMLQELAGGDR